MGAREIRIESDRVALVRTRRRRIVFGVLAALGVALPFASPGFLGLSVPLFIYGSLAFFSKPSEPNFALAVARKGPGALVVADDAIEATSFGDRVRYAREDVDGGWLANVWGPFVVLRMRGGDLVAASVASPAEGEALLASLGLSAEQKVLDIRLARGARELLWAALLLACIGAAVLPIAMLAGAFGAVNAGTLLFGATLAVVTLGGIVRSALGTVPRTIRIGTDGLSVRDRAGGRKFVRYADIDAIEPSTNALVVRRRGHRPLRLACWGVVQTTLLGRIREAMAAYREGPSEQKQKLLDRGGAPVDVWRERLAQLARGGGARGGYRDVALERDELAMILEDASAPPERRVAAAFALGSDPETRPRVRAVAEACANERLRIAIQRAEDGELDDLAALEAEPESVPARMVR